MVVLILLLVLLPSVHLKDSGDMRLVGGSSRCDGELQVKHLDEWTYVVFSEFLLITAAAVCQYLLCGSVVSHNRRTNSTHLAVELNSHCVRFGHSVSDCVYAANVSTNYYYGITCSENMNLILGSRLCFGSVLVNLNQSWNLVCVEDFDLKDAEVACRELGCGAVHVLQGALYDSSEDLVRQTFQCEGHESVLTDCPRSSLAETSCPSGKTTVLFCSEPVRLVGGSSGCDGTVELRHRGQWRPVMVNPNGLSWVAQTVCPLLDCGSVVSFDSILFFRYKPIWLLSPSCVKEERDLRACVYASGLPHMNGVQVECSRKPNLLHLLWLVPAFMVIMVAVILLIFYKRKIYSLNAPTTTGDSQPTNAENVTCDTASVCEDHVYQSLGMGTMDPEYIQLQPQPQSHYSE